MVDLLSPTAHPPGAGPRAPHASCDLSCHSVTLREDLIDPKKMSQEHTYHKLIVLKPADLAQLCRARKPAVMVTTSEDALDALVVKLFSSALAGVATAAVLATTTAAPLLLEPRPLLRPLPGRPPPKRRVVRSQLLNVAAGVVVGTDDEEDGTEEDEDEDEDENEGGWGKSSVRVRKGSLVLEDLGDNQSSEISPELNVPILERCWCRNACSLVRVEWFLPYNSQFTSDDSGEHLSLPGQT